MRALVLGIILMVLCAGRGWAGSSSDLNKTEKLAGKSATDFNENAIRHLCVCQDGSARDGRLGAIRKGLVGDPALDASITLSCIVLAFRNGAQDPGGEFACARWVPLGK